MPTEQMPEHLPRSGFVKTLFFSCQDEIGQHPRGRMARIEVDRL